MTGLDTVFRRMGVQAPADFIGAVLMIAFSAVVWVQLGRLTAGFGDPIVTASTVPRIFVSLVAVMSLVVLAMSFRGGFVGLDLPRIRPAFFLLASIFIFGASVRPLGLLLAGFFATTLAAFSSDEVRPVEAVISAAVLSSAATALFVYGLGLYLPVWPKGW